MTAAGLPGMCARTISSRCRTVSARRVQEIRIHNDVAAQSCYETYLVYFDTAMRLSYKASAHTILKVA